MDSSVSSKQVRQMFIDYFSEQVTFIPISSVVPHNDPTLLFTNAGMNQVRLFLRSVNLIRGVVGG